MPRHRSNPLALAILISLYERPMHPYEIAMTLRERHKHESVRLNYGSLYAIVGSLEKRGLIVPKETEREGRLPERTIYELTDTGTTEMHDWLSEMMSVPIKEYPEFEAALSFMPALPPDEALELLDERAVRLEERIAQTRQAEGFVEQIGLPRLFWVEADFAIKLLEAELDFVRELRGQIAEERLDGTAFWRDTHANPDRHHHDYTPADLRQLEDRLRANRQSPENSRQRNRKKER